MLSSGATTVIGVALAIWLGRNVKAIAAGIGFSAGIMVVISVAELIPESIQQAGVLVGVGSTAVGRG
jgi:zinc transporter ZupT